MAPKSWLGTALVMPGLAGQGLGGTRVGWARPWWHKCWLGTALVAHVLARQGLGSIRVSLVAPGLARS